MWICELTWLMFLVMSMTWLNSPENVSNFSIISLNPCRITAGGKSISPSWKRYWSMGVGTLLLQIPRVTYKGLEKRRQMRVGDFIG